jgi:hypothetical protein
VAMLELGVAPGSDGVGSSPPSTRRGKTTAATSTASATTRAVGPRPAEGESPLSQFTSLDQASRERHCCRCCSARRMRSSARSISARASPG